MLHRCSPSERTSSRGTRGPAHIHRSCPHIRRCRTLFRSISIRNSGIPLLCMHHQPPEGRHTASTDRYTARCTFRTRSRSTSWTSCTPSKRSRRSSTGRDSGIDRSDSIRSLTHTSRTIPHIHPTRIPARRTRACICIDPTGMHRGWNTPHTSPHNHRRRTPCHCSQDDMHTGRSHKHPLGRTPRIRHHNHRCHTPFHCSQGNTEHPRNHAGCRQSQNRW